MNQKVPLIILASASPRRQALLQQLGIDAQVLPADVDESILENEAAPDYVHRLACVKSAKIASERPDGLVIGADTTISIDGRILGKPVDKADCVRMLKMMQGRSHTVYTGVAVTGQSQADDCRTESCVVETTVRLRGMTEADICAYWITGEPEGKAGSYAIQGIGAALVDRIEGSYTNVVGLPLCETAKLLAGFDISLLNIFNFSSSPSLSQGDSA